MEVRLLGPLVVEGNGAQVTLGGRQRRAVLALLALAEGRVVSVDALVEALWGERPPATAVNTVQVHVSALRKALAAVSGGRHETIARDGAGYRLAVPRTSLDHVRFVRLTDDGGVLLARGDAARARAVFAEALALWRGPALADFEYEEWAQAEARRLEDLRLSCLEGRVEAELATGRHSELVGELETLVAEHPERERFTAQLMLALYRAGRQVDAVDVFRRARARLVDELGIDPSPELQALNRRILNQDETLIGPARAEAPVVRLPAAPTPLVGRQAEQAELISILTGMGGRLVTLTGTGGVGKTRLAIEVANGLAEHFAAGVFFVPLAPLQETALVVSAIANELGVSETAQQPLLETLKSHLRNERVLLVLDNFEHLLDAADVAAELLAAAPGVAILATSRVPLHLYGEHEYSLDPLALPDRHRLPPLAELARVDSVALFNARARAANRRFQLTQANAAAVAAICGRLDGLPLALELAAARVKLLPPNELASRLDKSLPVLTGGPRDAPERHRTLRATIGWSYELLDEEKQRLFARLSVFAGGCTLDAAEQVCGAELNTLAALVEKSLLRRSRERFWMLETIREFALELLQESGEAAQWARAHAEYFTAYAEQVEPHFVAAEQRIWGERLEVEHDNFRAALSNSLGRGDEQALRLAVALRRFWLTHSHLREGRRQLQAALFDAPSASPRLRAWALNGAGGLAAALGELAEARRLLTEGLALAREAGEQRAEAAALCDLAVVDSQLGAGTEAVARFEHAKALNAELDNERGVALCAMNIGTTYRALGELASAEVALEEGVLRARGLGNDSLLAAALGELGTVMLEQGRHVDAGPLLREALAAASALGDGVEAAWILHVMAVEAAQKGRPIRAAQLEGSAAAFDHELGSHLEPADASFVERNLATARLQTDDGAFESALRGGALFSLPEAVEYALGSPTD